MLAQLELAYGAFMIAERTATNGQKPVQHICAHDGLPIAGST
jgi:hypothetical protein